MGLEKKFASLIPGTRADLIVAGTSFINLGMTRWPLRRHWMPFLAFWGWLEGRANDPTSDTPTRVAAAVDAAAICDDGA